MDKTVRRYTNFDDIKADEYRYWQSRPIHERVDAISELTQEQYAMRGEAPMYPDFKELLSVLNESQVKYLVVGAYAVGIHAQPRATKDLDVLVRPDPENAQAVFSALAKFGAPLQGLSAADFAEAGPFFRMGHAPVGVDILTTIPGVVFEEAWKRRVEAVIDERTGLSANFISADDLIAAKLASGRLQDLADVEAIQKAQRLRPAKAAPVANADSLRE